MSLATERPPKSPSEASRTDVIMERIKKCLDRGRHPNTPESEAKTSILMAAKLMKEHNLTEAETFAASGTFQDEKPRAGESVVSVTRYDGKKAVNFAFTGSLAHAMNAFFDCKSYHQARGMSHQHVFYGIPKNTAAAAMAFEMCYNLILHWSMEKVGISARHSYGMGVAYGLYELAKGEQITWAGGPLEVAVDGKTAAEAYLKTQGVKLKSPRKQRGCRDVGSYRVGKQDSKKIDGE